MSELCTTVTVEEENISELTIVQIEGDSPSPLTADVDITVENSVVSGDGETLSDSLDVKVDDNVVTTETVELGPGESDTIKFKIEDMDAGDRQICGEL